MQNKIIKFLQEIGKHFLATTPKAKSMKEQIDKLNYIKIIIFFNSVFETHY